MIKTREQWLNAMAIAMISLFSKAGFELKGVKYRISCGIPAGRGGNSKKAIGQCWNDALSADKTHEIFISPIISDKVYVAAILVHELIHAIVGVKEGHKGAFKRCALAVGLEGKMTETNPSKELTEWITSAIAKIGDYPHAMLDISQRQKQTTRMIKVVCPECGYVVRTSAKWAEIGLPVCCCGGEMEIG